ncbi:hypothetical protein LCGC14_1112570 [marine sediment metagenome]|uniref:Uncharacterized protein n=1 Tax=marine sediment metagenome TaxID=412755 RepID=A0A0F9M6A9_9ZZZZ
MKAVVKYTLPKECGPDEIGETTVCDADPSYQKWVDKYNAERVAKLDADFRRGFITRIGLPVEFGYDNPLMMLQYLSLGHGIHFHIGLIIHSVEITTEPEP